MRMRKRVVVWLSFHSWLKIVMTSCLVGLMLFIFTYELPSTKTWTYWTMPLSGKVIALDAGHGGPDGGAESKSGVIEKDVTLAISKYLRDLLQESGALVVMTREEDQDLAKQGTKGLSKRKTEDLLNRVEYVNKSKADMLISVHLNSITSSRWHGAQTFYYPNHQDNSTLASFIQNELKTTLGNTNRVAKTVDSIYLLKAMQIPSALVEVGFLSNEEEARLLATDKYQKQLAEAIYRGILRYYSGERMGSQ